MRTRVTHVLPLALVLLLATMTLGLQYLTQGGYSSDAGVKRHEPDAIIENFTVHRLGDTGRPQYTISAPKMMHYPDDDSAEVVSPRIVQLADDGGNITATANRGVVTKGGEEARLYGNVLVVRSATPKQEEARARTEFLHVFPEQRIARTDSAVTFTEGRSTLTGVGMELDKNTGVMTLLSRVRGTYDAPKR